MQGKNLYSSIIEKIFLTRYKIGARNVDFEREDIVRTANELGISLPKNVGDLVYSFRYRANLPEAIRSKAGPNEMWIIRPIGIAKYRFALVPNRPILPNPNLSIIKVPNATPGIVEKYALNDEQALLAKVRYNRLVDIFTGVTCYSLQNHLRTTVPNIGQVETDEIYVGVDKKGTQYVLPIQAKGPSDRVGVVQIEQDVAICQERFPLLVCRPLASQLMEKEVIAMFEFEQGEDGSTITSEKHYRLVRPNDLTDSDLESYRNSQT